jgi:geranylgeranyl reductase family protein
MRHIFTSMIFYYGRRGPGRQLFLTINNIFPQHSAMKTKVLIIGAGPSGGMAAYRLASKGFRDFLIVDRSDFPRMKPCAGGISPASHRFLKTMGLDHLLAGLKPSARMKRLRVIGPRGQDIVVTSNLKAVTINRRIFDAAILDRARSLGATFVPRFTVRSLLRDAEGRIIGASDGSALIEAEVTILATGGHNKNFREEYLTDKRPLRLIYSRIGWWKDFDIQEDTMEMVFDRDYLPHYGWVFPEGDGVVNIGVCLYEDKLKGRNVTRVFDDFIEKYYAKRLEHATQIGRSLSYVINTSSGVRDVYANRMLCAGEAGRMCNPASAEGISYAMESGVLAADACLRAYERGSGGKPEEKSLEYYETICRKAFNFRLRRAAVFSRLVDSPLLNPMISISMSKFAQSIVSMIFEDS